MRRVIDVTIYDTDTANLLADNTSYGRSPLLTNGRATFLYRTEAGDYFAYHVTCRYCEHDEIEPLSTADAVRLYRDLKDDYAVAFAVAFPTLPVNTD